MLQSHTPHPNSVYLLTPLASTDVCHFFCISYKTAKEAQLKAAKEARAKWRAGEELTEQQFWFMARYFHMMTCCSLARHPHVCLFTDTSCID